MAADARTWIDANQLEHEGAAIGYVIREGTSPEEELYRELGYPRDIEPRPVGRVGAGCDCGWRSPRWRAEAAWQPYGVALAQGDQERVHALWWRHLELDVIGGGVTGIGALPRRARS